MDALFPAVAQATTDPVPAFVVAEKGTFNLTTGVGVPQVIYENTMDAYDGWMKGQWQYPVSKLGRFDASFISFELPLVLILILLGIAHICTRPLRIKKDPEAIEMQVAEGNFVHIDTLGSTSIGRLVGIITHEQMSLFLTTVTFAAIVAFKIICGNTTANAGTLLVILLVATCLSAVRELNSTRTNVARFVVKLIMVGAVHGAYIGYTNSAFNAKTSGKEIGAQPLFIWAGLTYASAILVSMFLSMKEYSSKDNKQKVGDIVELLRKGEYLYYVNDIEAVVVTFSICTFIVLESFFVANVATAYYNSAFYFLWTIPVYYFACMMFMLVRNPTTWAPIMFNILYIGVGFTILILAQFHVSSIPFRETDGRWKRQFGSPKHPHTNQIGLRLDYMAPTVELDVPVTLDGVTRDLATAAEIADADISTHTHANVDKWGQPYVRQIVMQKAGLVSLELLSALFLAFAFLSMEYTRRVNYNKMTMNGREAKQNSKMYGGYKTSV